MRRTLHQEYLMMVLLGYMVMWVDYELCRIVESTGDTRRTGTLMISGTEKEWIVAVVIPRHLPSNG